MSSPEFVQVQVPDDWPTKGQTRPALVLRRNDDGSADLLVFHHPEDRQTGPNETQLRVPAERFKAEEAKPAPPTTAKAGETARDWEELGPFVGYAKETAQAENEPAPPPAPARGMQAGRAEAANEVP